MTPIDELNKDALEDACNAARERCEDILEGIVEERARQVLIEHGGNTDEFDKGNTRNDWVAYITAYAGRAGANGKNERQGENFRQNMIQVAALAVAAIEAHDKGWC